MVIFAALIGNTLISITKFIAVSITGSTGIEPDFEPRAAAMFVNP